ncbi:MAG: PIN domain nuclease [Microthrixaceae bacterium]|nr:PIN domain nuclease [Microthrixaceae bacterium]
MSTVLVDTSAWSRFYRSDIPETDPYVSAVQHEIAARGVVTTGVVYLELLRGFTQSGTKEEIHRQFDSVPFIEPRRADYAGAAELGTRCRRAGVQLGAVDALIAQVCIANDLTLLTADGDFVHAARHVPLKLWAPT